MRRPWPFIIIYKLWIIVDQNPLGYTKPDKYIFYMSIEQQIQLV